MGGTKTKSTQEVNQTQNTRPLAEQMPYLNKAWTQASDLLDRSNANPYTGNFIADPSKDQYGAFADALNWATGAGRNAAGQIGQTGTGQLATGTAGQSAALSGLLGAATRDQTASNIDAANRYASAQNVSGIVDAAMYDARRNAAENVQPGITRSAAASGNINSDRTALQRGVVDRGLAEQTANLSATTRSNLFNQGLTMAQQQNAQQLAALGAAGTLGSTAAQQGYIGAQQGFDNTGKTLTAQQAAAMGAQGLEQSKLDNSLKQWYAQYQQPWTNLQQYYGITGDLKGGTSQTTGTTTTTQTQNPGIMGTIGQGIGIFGSLFCDERYKDVLSGPIGNFHGIAPTYLYTYKHDPKQLHIGPMAQDVAKVRPDVVRDVGGALMIDTHKI